MYKKLILSLIVLGLALSGPIGADLLGIQNFEDDEIYFPGWPLLPTTDAHGIPDFGNGFANGVTAATVTFDVTDGRGNWQLDTIEFFYGYGANSGGDYPDLWDSLYPGDLFLSFSGAFAGASDYWTHVVKLPDSRSGSYPEVNKGTYAVYDLGSSRPIANDPGATNYLLASADNYRKGHPYAVDINDLDDSMIVGYADFSGWDKPAGAGDLVSSLFTFTNGGGLNLTAAPGTTETLTFGWTQMCANDIMLGSAAIPGGEIPEPGTLLLLGTGLVGLVIRRRRQS